MKPINPFGTEKSRAEAMKTFVPRDKSPSRPKGEVKASPKERLGLDEKAIKVGIDKAREAVSSLSANGATRKAVESLAEALESVVESNK